MTKMFCSLALNTHKLVDVDKVVEINLKRQRLTKQMALSGSDFETQSKKKALQKKNF